MQDLQETHKFCVWV